MIICHSRRFIVFSNPKTGSETIRSLLSGYCEERVLPYRARNRLYPFYPHMCPAEAAAVFAARGWNFGGYRRITLIRNPYPRLVSLYRMIADVDRVWVLRRRLGLPVPAFPDWLAGTRPSGSGGGGWRHQRWRRFGTWSARAWTHDAAGRPLVTDVLRLEALADELPAVLARLGIAAPPVLPVINARPRTDWRNWYDPESTAMVAARYAWDLRHYYKSSGFSDAGERAA